MMKRIFLDVETGGLDPEADALLEVCMRKESGEELQFYIDPPVGVLINPEAIEVNKIDLNKLKQEGKLIDENYACTLIYDFLAGEKYIFIGYNIDFDLQFIKRLFKRNFLSYPSQIGSRYNIDLFSVCLFLKDTNKINPENLKLQTLRDYFCIKFNGEGHTARSDVYTTQKLYETLNEQFFNKWVRQCLKGLNLK